MRIFEHIFFEFQVFFRRFDSEVDTDESAHSAWLALTFLVWMNFLGAVWFIEGIFKTTVLPEDLSPVWVLGGGISLAIVTHRLWYWIPNRQRIIEAHISDTDQETKFRKNVTRSFLLLSMLVPIVGIVVSV